MWGKSVSQNPKGGRAWHVWGTAMSPGWVKYAKQRESHAEQVGKAPRDEGLETLGSF